MWLCETTGRLKELNIKNVWDVPCMMVNSIHTVTYSFPPFSFLCLEFLPAGDPSYQHLCMSKFPSA